MFICLRRRMNIKTYPPGKNFEFILVSGRPREFPIFYMYILNRVRGCDVMAAVTANTLRRDLIEQLKGKGAVERFYIDMVDQYIFFWSTTKRLQKDIEDRGVSVPYDNGGGQKGAKKNDSIAELVKVNAQMIKILDKLKIQAPEAKLEDDEPSLNLV